MMLTKEVAAKANFNKWSQRAMLLKYQIKVLRSQRTDHEYQDVLVRKVMPLIRLMFPMQHAQWIQEKKAFSQKRDELKKAALIEIKQVLACLKQRLQEAGLMDDETLKQCLSSIESVLEFREKYVMPSYIEIAHDRLKHLCEVICGIRCEDLIKDYAEIRYSLKYKDEPQKAGDFQAYRCIDCGYLYCDSTAPKNIDGQPTPFEDVGSNWTCPIAGGDQSNFQKYQLPILYNVPIIDTYKASFVPSIYELKELDDLISRHGRAWASRPDWVAWESLYNIEWSFNVSRDYFRNKDLHYETPADCERTAFLVERDASRAEVKSIQSKRQKRNRVYLFRSDFVDPNLDRIFKSLCGEDDSSNNLESADYAAFPYGIELTLEDDNHLRLMVEWIPGIIEVCHMHTFQELEKINGDPMKNSMYDFICALLESPGVLVKIKPVEGANAKKYLSRAGISGTIAKFFIVERGHEHAILGFTRRVLTNESEVTLKSLCARIQKLEHVRWCTN